MRVLIVEDETVLRANLLDRLLLAGMDVVAAPNGPIGLAFATDPTLQLDAAVIDLHLGGPIDGERIASVLDERCPDSRIVVTSGRYDLLDLHWMSRGWTLVPKPFRMRALVAHLTGRTGPAGTPPAPWRQGGTNPKRNTASVAFH